ncbi:MAG: DUF1549 domain-containing protein, partial [Verrucomicrobiota bacterium]
MAICVCIDPVKVPFMRRLAILPILFLPAFPVVGAEVEEETSLSKKELRQAKREARNANDPAKQALKGIDELPPLADLGNTPLPPLNQSLRLSAEEVAAEAEAIDAMIREKLSQDGGKPNAPASDEVFVRRVYLDIVGRIPTPEETQDFLDDSQADKRARLIDELLLSYGYRSHQFNWIADMLRYKSSTRRAHNGLYQRWLKDNLRTNKGWDQMVHELLTAEGSLATNGATGYLLRDTGMPLDSLSNTLTLFLGANISCAQCHDHPLAEWTQMEFYEMAAFFGATDVSSRDPRKISKRIATKQNSKQDGIAVSAPNMYRVKTLPANHVVLPDDYAYSDAEPGDAVEPYLMFWESGSNKTPAYDVDLDTPENLRESFAHWMTHSDNPRFGISIANRIWQRAFGIAIQEPIEDLDDISKASNPELMRHVGKVLVDQQFDLREFQRIVFNTQAYQAAANPTPPIGDISCYSFSGPVLRRMTAEQAWDSIMFLGYGAKVDEYQIDTSHRSTRMAFDFDAFNEDAIRQRIIDTKEAGYLDVKARFQERDLVNADRRPEGFRKTYYLRASELPQPGRDWHFLRMFG